MKATVNCDIYISEIATKSTIGEVSVHANSQFELFTFISTCTNLYPGHSYKVQKKKTVLMNESENITKQEYSNTFLQVTIIVHISLKKLFWVSNW